MSELETRELRAKIELGLQLAYRRLLEQKKRENGCLVFSRGGKIVKVRARNIK